MAELAAGGTFREGASCQGGEAVIAWVNHSGSTMPKPLMRTPVLYALAAGCALAQTPPPAQPQPDLASDRDHSFAAEDHPVQLDQLADRVRVFTQEDLERGGARTLGEFLAQELPAQFQQGGGPGLPTRAYQGGARPQDTLVLLDGARLSDPSQAAPDLDAIPLAGIVRIEILTGTESSRSGPGAQGGIVALFTAGAALGGSMGEVAAQGGNNGQSQGRALPSFGWGSGYLHGGAQARREDQATDTAQPYRTATSFLGFGQRMGPALLTLGYRNHYQGVPDPYALATPTTRVYDPAREAAYRDEAGSLGLRFDLAPGVDLSFRAAAETVDRNDPVQGSSTLALTHGRTTQADLALGAGGGLFALTAHAGGFESRGERPVAGVGNDEGRARHGELGFAARFQPLPALRFTAEAGLHTDRHDLTPIGLAPSGSSGHATTYRLTANLGLPLGFRAYAGGGQGYTAPSLPQLLFNVRAGAPDLEPEKNGFGFFGFGWGHGHWTGRLESSRSAYREAIGFSGGAFRNADHLRVQGTEASLGYTRGGFGAEGFARAQEARDLNGPTDPFGTPVSAERPFHSHGLKTHYGWTRVRLDLRYRETGASYQIAGPNVRGLPAPIIATRTVFRELTTIATFTLTKHWTLVARGEHLLQPRTSVDEWLTRQTDDENNANRAYGLPAQGPSGSLEVIFRY